jgi:hypothetical protein
MAMATRQATKQKVPVSERATIQRINRRLKPDMCALKQTRGERARLEVGDWHVIDYTHNIIVAQNINLDSYAHEIGALAEHEEVVLDE